MRSEVLQSPAMPASLRRRNQVGRRCRCKYPKSSVLVRNSQKVCKVCRVMTLGSGSQGHSKRVWVGRLRSEFSAGAERGGMLISLPWSVLANPLESLHGLWQRPMGDDGLAPFSFTGALSPVHKS